MTALDLFGLKLPPGWCHLDDWSADTLPTNSETIELASVASWAARDRPTSTIAVRWGDSRTSPLRAIAEYRAFDRTGWTVRSIADSLIDTLAGDPEIELRSLDAVRLRAGHAGVVISEIVTAGAASPELLIARFRAFLLMATATRGLEITLSTPHLEDVDRLTAEGIAMLDSLVVNEELET